MLVYGPLAHGLLTGTLNTNTVFAADDWRSTSEVFSGSTFELNLATVRALAMFAADLGVTVSQLAIAWTLANPACRSPSSVPGKRVISKTVSPPRTCR